MPPQKLLEFNTVKELIATIGGKDAIDLVNLAQQKKRPFTDEEIANKLKVRITEIRTALNRLHFRGIACYQKTKNVKTGWFSYTWQIKTKRIAELLLEKQAEEIEKLKKSLAYEKNYVFFSCKERCELVPFEVAAELQFKCPKCGCPMEGINNKKRIREIKNQIKRIALESKKASRLV